MQGKLPETQLQAQPPSGAARPVDGTTTLDSIFAGLGARTGTLFRLPVIQLVLAVSLSMLSWMTTEVSASASFSKGPYRRACRDLVKQGILIVQGFSAVFAI
jgi:hypothetical protein